MIYEEPINKDIRTARKSITPSGHFGNSPNMIKEIQNFITEEEQRFLLNFITQNTTWDITESHWNENGNIIYDHSVWDNRVCSYHNLLKNNKEVVAVLENMINRLKVEIESFFKVEADPTTPAMVRWPVGTMQFPHADKELHEGPDAGKENDFPWYDLGTVFYLNDDYEGGELYFPLQNIIFKPKARAVYFFPGDKYFIHGVTPVTSGCRYTAPFFWTVTKILGDPIPHE